MELTGYEEKIIRTQNETRWGRHLAFEMQNCMPTYITTLDNS